MKRILMLIVGLALTSIAQADRIKDIADVAGVRSNQLIGYGLVVGLDGSGDQVSQTPFTVQSMKNMLAQYGITMPANVTPQVKNIAAVMVHGDLPPFAKAGQRIDVTVSSLGNASSLRGGTLLMTPLKGADGEVYALAQGSLIVGGLGAQGSDGSKITINVPSVGMIPNGASVERPSPTRLGGLDALTLNLHSGDFTTAKRVADAINTAIGMGTAYPMDDTSVRVQAPRNQGQRVVFMSMIENLTLEPGEASARVIINSRTGTVIIGQRVRVTAAAVAHGSLVVTVTENQQVSQPGPLSGGQTTVVPQSNVQIEEGNKRMFLFSPGVSLQNIVEAVNKVGAAPGDLVAILEALKAAGALHAELIVI